MSIACQKPPLTDGAHPYTTFGLASQQYFDLDRQNEALTDKIVDIIHSEVLVDEILQMHTRHLITLRRYQARLKRSLMRSGMNCQTSKKNARIKYVPADHNSIMLKTSSKSLTKE